MRIDVITQPATEPVSLAEIQGWLLLDGVGSPPVTPFDGRITDMVKSAREECESRTNRAFVRQTLRLTLPNFPRLCSAFFGDSYITNHASWPHLHDAVRQRVIELPRPPLISVQSVGYYDLDNVAQVMDPSLYIVIGTGAGMPAQLQPLNNAWPDTYLREDAVRITYLAGYEAAGSPTVPTDTSAIPASIKAAIKLAVERDFNPMSADQQDQLNRSIDTKLARYKVHKL